MQNKSICDFECQGIAKTSKLEVIPSILSCNQLLKNLVSHERPVCNAECQKNEAFNSDKALTCCLILEFLKTYNIHGQIQILA